MTTPELVEQVEEAFPYVPRPAVADLAFHDDGCAHCEMTVRELAKHSGPELPTSVIRYLHGELSTLSPEATAWVLPSYLRHVVAHEDDRDPLPTEFLIYALGPEGNDVAELQARLSSLSVRQIEVLAAVIRHLASEPRWSDYYAAELNRAKVFLGSLAESARRRTRG